MSQSCTSTPIPDPDAQLIAVCAAFRQDLAAYAAALDSVAHIKPSEITPAQVRKFHSQTEKIHRSIEAGAFVIQGTRSVGASGRGAKVAALHGYMRLLGLSDGELLELDLAKSVIADFAQALSRPN